MGVLFYNGLEYVPVIEAACALALSEVMGEKA